VRILITGISGFLGSHLARHWRAAGHSISGTARRSSPDVIALPLGNPPPQDCFTGIDVVIHAAYDRDAGVERNVVGTATLCEEAERAGVAYQVFISSYAARSESQAVYGRMKYQLETLFLQRGHTVVRPGLVIGNGGMFGRNLKTILHSPVIPLLDGGRDLIPVLAIQDFVRAMNTLVTERRTGVFNLFNPELVPMRTLVETITKAAGRRPWLLNVPLNLALRFLTTAEKLHIPFPAESDNVRSLKQSLPHVYQSDLDGLIARPCSFQAMIEAAVIQELRNS
jgi:NADH dehydrogenase